MKKIKITVEMGDEAATLSLNTNMEFSNILKHIGEIKNEETVENFIEKQLLLENPFGSIYESPDGGKTIYKRKVGESNRELISKKQFKVETLHDMGGSYEITMEGEWICEYCGESTIGAEYDYLVGTNHLSCTLKNESKKQ
jgi:hypothetical protein